MILKNNLQNEWSKLSQEIGQLKIISKDFFVFLLVLKTPVFFLLKKLYANLVVKFFCLGYN